MKANSTFFILLLVSVFIMTGCGEKSPTQPPTATVSSVVVSPTAVSVAKGYTYQFSTVVNGSNNPSQSVTWSVIGGLSNSTSISATGLLTVGSSESATTLTVRATSTADTSKNGTSTVTVTNTPPTVTSVVVSPIAVSVVKGTTQQFSADVNGSNNPPHTVTWSVTGGITGTNINTNGLLTVASGETGTTLTVRATSTFDTSKSGIATVTVTNTAVVNVNPPTADVLKGQTQQFSATYGSGQQTFSWVVMGATSIGTNINNNGLLVVAINEMAPSLIITATLTTDNSKSGNATVSVKTVTSVAVSPNNLTLLRGTTQQYNAMVNGANNPSQDVTWTVIGGVDGTTIDGNGLLSIDSNESAHTLTVKATSILDPTKNGSVTVNIANVTTVVVSPATSTVPFGQTRQFSAVVNGHNSLPQTVTWAVTGGVNGTNINDSGLLTVASNESLTATLTITATSTYDTTKSGNATVNIAQVTTVVVSPATVTVPFGQTRQFNAVVNGHNSLPQTVTWEVIGGVNGTSINDSGFLTVASNETNTTLTVRATSTYDSTKSGTSTVTTTIIGTVGPAGGYIFYDKGNYSDGWRYLEAAPASSEFTAPWGLYGIACNGTNTGIGTGQANTTAIINTLNTNGETGKAAQLCVALTINGYSDWFLPSKDELNQMYLNLRVGNNIGGFDASGNWPGGYYWSSSVSSSVYTWCQRFSDGGQSYGYYTDYSRDREFRVRGVRAF